MRSATASPDMVLSHGDFTPAQVLLDGQDVAVVDLDTLCWADPALDLGRFLAHLELLAVKRGGDAATPLVHDLTRAFLRGYGEATPRTAAAAEATDRIALYKTTTLARTACAPAASSRTTASSWRWACSIPPTPGGLTYDAAFGHRPRRRLPRRLRRPPRVARGADGWGTSG